MPSKKSEYQSRWYRKHASKHKERVKTRNSRIIDENREKMYQYLSDKPCVDCGESDVLVLEFDHLDPSSKKYDVGYMLGSAFSWKTILTEIAKCLVRCANCHRRKTAKDRGWWKMVRREGLEPSAS